MSLSLPFPLAVTLRVRPAVMASPVGAVHGGSRSMALVAVVPPLNIRKSPAPTTGCNLAGERGGTATNKEKAISLKRGGLLVECCT